MKEAIGGTSLFAIVMAILAVFGVYISVTINWANSYKVKDEILFYIQKNKGMNSQTIKDINSYTKKNGYSSRGTCPDNPCWVAFNVNKADGKSMSKSNASYCVRLMNYESKNTNIDTAYYSVKVFFSLEVPIISSFNITIEGDTPSIVNVKEEYIKNENCKVK